MRGFLIFLLCMVAVSPVWAKGPVVLELFTSRSCGASPSADALLHEILRDPGQSDVIGIACYVLPFRAEGQDAWPERKFCNNRQGGYMYSVGFQSMSTPLMIMNGKYELSGGDETLVRSALNMARVEEDIYSLDLHLDNDVLRFTLPAMGDQGPLSVWLYYATDVSIEETGAEDGEDLGVSTYRYAARDLKELMSWDGNPQNLAVDVGHYDGPGKIAVLVQPYDGAILAAGQLIIR